jgi:hypothetical protein
LAICVAVDTIINLLFNLFYFNVKYVTLVLVVFEPLYYILTMLAIVAKRVRISIFFAIARYVVLVQLHYFFMKLLVEVTRDQ